VEDTSQTWYILYRDDGPDGPCGQSCHVTSPWCQLYRFVGTHGECMDRVEKLMGRGRKRPRANIFANSEVVANQFGCDRIKSIF